MIFLLSYEYLLKKEKKQYNRLILLKKHRDLFLFLITFLLMQPIIAQYQIPKKPKFQTSVYDYVNLLSRREKIILENKLIKYSDSTSTQIVVAIISSTKGEQIAYLATNWGEEWGIGQEKEDNGILMLLAKNDKKITISTGKGVEHLLTDFTSRQIIENDIIPQFKQGYFYDGLDKGVNAIFKVMNGEYQRTLKKNNEFDPSFIIFIIILIIFFILISRGNKNNRGGRKSYRKRTIATDIFETIILSNLGRGGFGNGGFGRSSSGGFGGGFGGGSFGGGGATGGW